MRTPVMNGGVAEQPKAAGEKGVSGRVAGLKDVLKGHRRLPTWAKVFVFMA